MLAEEFPCLFLRERVVAYHSLARAQKISALFCFGQVQYSLFPRIWPLTELLLISVSLRVKVCCDLESSSTNMLSEVNSLSRVNFWLMNVKMSPISPFFCSDPLMFLFRFTLLRRLG